MKFLLMCYFSEDLWGKIPETQRNDIMQQYGALLKETVKSGHLLDGAMLARSHMATTVRRQAGKPVITDGPFAETKEQLGGYHLMECKDMEEAISIALRIPTLPFGGTIEIRAVELSEV
ncbi:YciI family protein [bacterium]|nr:YciI family protein [bacterium]MCI0604852.1 YciI family protein [bacterium]